MSMRDAGPEPLAETLLRDVTDAMIAESMVTRDPASSDDGAEPPTESTPLPPKPRDIISQTAYDFVVRWETGGRAYYEGVIRGRPVWPGFNSGITIGCGFDLGYHDLGDFAAQWKIRLAASDFARLSAVLGFRTMPPDRDTKVVKAKQLVASLSDIVVPWAVAIEQFDGAKLPKLTADLYRALDHLDRLHPHSRGALLSLMFNRGTPFGNPDDRYREMRRIRELMTAGSPPDFRQIPAELRSMKRIWGEASSLAERREGEAKLFEAGLREQRLTESASLLSAGHATEGAAVGEIPDGGEGEQSDVADEETSLEGLADFPTESGRLSPADVRWNPDDGDQPDYGHLEGLSIAGPFTVTPDDIEALITGNEFSPLSGFLVLAIRGAALVGGDRENVASLEFVDQRPDHRAFRCVIGVFDTARRRFHAYRASTAPNAAYVFKCFQQAQAGVPTGGLSGNILPTGCYTYTIGIHKAGQKGEIPGVLRLSTTASGASPVVVQRSLSDLVYDRRDLFTVATPGDNIHPGILSEGFSSAGCLTIPGRYVGGQHTGSWRRFRAASGLEGAANGGQRSAVLLTGLDLALATRMRAGLADKASLRRLRHGSRGVRVQALQAALGLNPDAAGIFGPITRKSLCELQATRLGFADGIYSPRMDTLLGLNVYASA